MLKGFQQFLLRGNVIDLAVAVVVGTAFSAIVTSFVTNIVTPLIGAIGGQPDFSGLYFTINSSQFMIGEFLNAIIAFVMIAAVIYFMVVTPMNKLMEKMKKGEKLEKTDRACPECLSIIPIKAKRCKFCTAVVKGK